MTYLEHAPPSTGKETDTIYKEKTQDLALVRVFELATDTPRRPHVDVPVVNPGDGVALQANNITLAQI